MRKLAISLALLASTSLVNAADLSLPTKASVAPVSVGYPYTSNGFYFGVGTSGTAANASVANTGIAAIGASLDGIIGWQWKGGLDFIAIENIASYTNLGNSGNCITLNATITCDVNARFSDVVRAKFGFPISSVTGLLPNLSSAFPALPSLPNCSNGTQHPYIYIAAHFDDISSDFGLMNARAWTIQPEAGLGLMSQFTNGLVADVSAGCTFANQGITIGTPAGNIGSTLGRKCTARLGLLY